MSGRGGRGGRGGGRGGINKSFNREQLNALGVGATEPSPCPPPLYPLLDKKAVPLTPSIEMDYLLILKQDFIDHMQLSASYLKVQDSKAQPQQEIEKLVAQLPVVKEKYDWSLFPSELRPKLLAKRIKKKITKEVNITQRLDILEKLEEKLVDGDNKAADGSKEGEDAEEDVEAIEDEQDEEMDDGTDYANNYFDNGEDYEDDDDTFDDGPVY